MQRIGWEVRPGPADRKSSSAPNHSIVLDPQPRQITKASRWKFANPIQQHVLSETGGYRYNPDAIPCRQKTSPSDCTAMQTVFESAEWWAIITKSPRHRWPRHFADGFLDAPNFAVWHVMQLCIIGVYRPRKLMVLIIPSSRTREGCDICNNNGLSIHPWVVRGSGWATDWVRLVR